MTSTKNLLVLTSSSGENLKMAQKFIEIAMKINIESELIDLTEIDLPLFNPRTSDQETTLKTLQVLEKKMNSYSHWVICAPEYNGSIPPVFTSALAWLSVQNDDFRQLFNGRPIAMASFSGGGGMELLVSLRIQLTHLGAQVVGRQLMSNNNKPAKDESIEDLLKRLLQMEPIEF